MNLGLKGRKAIVTGGTRGIGRAVAELLADEGANLALCARKPQEVGETVEALQKKRVQVAGDVVDVTDRAGYCAWLEQASSALGGVDIFVPNVSGMGVDLSEEAWKASFDTDLMHTVRGVEALLPALARSEAASIVVIGTIAAVENFYSPTAYGAMKAALLTYAQQMGAAVAEHGIRINTVSPGPVYFPGGVWDRNKQADPEAFKAVEARCRLGRMATPDDVARCVAFLASPAAEYVTGTNMIVDGGFTERVQF